MKKYLVPIVIISLIVLSALLTGCYSSGEKENNTLLVEMEFKKSKLIEEKNIEKIDDAINKILSEYNLSANFISHSFENPLKVTINLNINNENINKLEEKFKEDIGDTILYKTVNPGLNINSNQKNGVFLYCELLPNEIYTEITPVILEKTVDVLKKRMKDIDLKNTIIKSHLEDRILIVLPPNDKTEETINMIQKNALLEFKEQNPENPDEWRTVLTGDIIKDAEAKIDPEYGSSYIAFELNEEAAKDFAEITERNFKKPVAIYFDGKEISAPVVMSVIADGKCQITMGIFGSPEEEEEEAKSLARFLRAGALPVPIKFIEECVIYE